MNILERLDQDLQNCVATGYVPVAIRLGWCEMGLFLQAAKVQHPDLDLDDPPVRFNSYKQIPIYLDNCDTSIQIGYVRPECDNPDDFHPVY